MRKYGGVVYHTGWKTANSAIPADPAKKKITSEESSRQDAQVANLPEPSNLATVLSFLTFFAELEETGMGDIIFFCLFFCRSVSCLSVFGACGERSIEDEEESGLKAKRRRTGQEEDAKDGRDHSSAEKMSRGTRRKSPS